MNAALIILGVVIIAVLVAIVWLLLRPKPESKPDQSMLMLAQRLEGLERSMALQLEQSRQSAERSSHTVMSQVQSFTRGMTELQEAVKVVQEKVHDVVSFQDIFKSPKLRGNWGEYSLENALTQYFPRAAWELQHPFSSGEVVDAVLKLPNGLLVPIDSKFNWENFQKMAEADNEIAKDGFRKTFLGDVKKKVDEIAKKYVLPGENTADFALMYVPAESIYYEIINNVKEADIADYARRSKVILCSPNTFYLTVSAIQHWFHDTQFSQQTQAIMKKLGTVITDAGKLSDDFRKLGDHLSDASSAYERSEKKLGQLVERTQKVIELGAEDDKRLE
ncbi:MAG TPA: DNA recombination protein RmuC [Candidatus Paceibacterota bacterium]|nr:DNA recombination protein RmuC [Candidatus Paceibacterota bacterium]